MDPPVYQQLRVLLTRTVVEFCRKHNYFEEELKIQGTVCVTSDSSSFLVTQISEKFNASNGDSVSSCMRSLAPMFSHIAPFMAPNLGLFHQAFPFAENQEERSLQESINEHDEDDQKSTQGNSPSEIAAITSVNLTPIWKGTNGKHKQRRKIRQTVPPGDTVRLTSCSPVVSDHSEYTGSERSSTPLSQNPDSFNCERLLKGKRVHVCVDSSSGQSAEKPKKPKHDFGQKTSETMSTEDGENFNENCNLSAPVCVKVENNSLNMVKSSIGERGNKRLFGSNKTADQSLSALIMQSQPALYSSAIPGLHGQRGTSGVNAMYMEKCGQSSWRCVLCNAEYNSRGTLHRHIDSRHLGRSYPCTICNMVFESHSGLSRHLRYKHTQHMPLACTMCPEKFINESALDQHMSRKHAFSSLDDQDH